MSGVECQKCARKSQLFLCQQCQNDLKDLLNGLAQGQELPNGKRAAGWIEYLEDAVHGHTRLGESARRSTERNSPLPVHLGASQLLENVHGLLTRLVQEICDDRGVQVP